MDRRLLDYYPPVVRDIRDMRALCEAQQPEVSGAWDAAQAALDDQFVQTSGEYGVGRWEKILNIFPKATDSLSDRKFRIKARLNERLPFTLRVLEAQLEHLCGPGGFSLAILPGESLLTVKVALEAKNNFTDVALLLQRIVPAAIQIRLSLKYNQHGTLAPFTHGHLAGYTHANLRDEVVQ